MHDCQHELLPISFAIHGGYRGNVPDIATLYLLAAASIMEELIHQHADKGCYSLRFAFWLDVGSFETHVASLNLAIAQLQDGMVRFAGRYSTAIVDLKFSHGIADTYSKALAGCVAESWCRYMFFIEDDYIIKLGSVSHSARDLVNLLDDQKQVNYVKFGTEGTGDGWNGPCMKEDLSMGIPLTWMGGWVNNAHIGRATAMTALMSLVHDPTATRNWLECHHDHRRLSLFSMCHHVTYHCQSSEPFFRTPSVCDTTGHLKCGELISNFQQVNSTACVDNEGHTPQFHHCGLTMYGVPGHDSAIHLNGKKFNSTSFWAQDSQSKNRLVHAFADWGQPSELKSCQVD